MFLDSTLHAPLSTLHGPAGDRLLGESVSADEQERVEVWLRSGEEGAPAVEVRQYHWGFGVGWYVQKTMTFDAAQAGAIAALLGLAGAPAPDSRLSPSLTPTRRRARAVAEGNTVQLVFD